MALILTLVLVSLCVLATSVSDEDDFVMGYSDTFNVDGFTYETIQPDEVRLIGYDGSDTNIEISSSVSYELTTYMVKYIGDGAFKNNENIRSVNITCIPASSEKGVSGIEMIGDSAFEGCTSLSELVIPDSVTTLGKDSFKNCKGIVKLKMPVSLNTTIERSRQLMVHEPIFTGTVGLKEMVFSKGTGRCCDYSWSTAEDAPWTQSKEEMTVVFEEGIHYIGKEMFVKSNKIASLVFPDTLTSMSTSVFKDKALVRELTMPLGIEQGAQNINSMSGLEKITFTKGTKEPIDYPGYAMYLIKGTFHCSDLETVVFQEGIERLGKKILFGNTVKNVILPESLKVIDEGAFTDCKYLKSIVIPEGVEEIGNNAFKNCSNLGTVNIPGSMTKIKKDAFKGCSGLNSVTFLEGLTAIDQSAFEGCKSIKSLKLPDTVTKLGKSTFKNCSSLTDLSVPISLNTVVKNKDPAFEGCKAIENVTLTKGTGNGHDYGDNTYTPWHINKGSLKNLKIAEGVIHIGNKSFKDLGKVNNIPLPSTLKSIGDCAFKGCSSLTDLTLPDSVTEIGKEAFKGCSALASVTFPEGLTTIDQRAFEGCKFIKSLKLPDTVTKLGKSAFKNCSYLTDLSVPVNLDTVVNNKDPAFEGCKAIENITLTKGTGNGHDYGNNTHTPWRISKDAFNTLVMEDGIESIGKNTFKGCDALRDIRFCAGLKSMGDNAFEGFLFFESDGVTKMTVDAEHLSGCSFSGNKSSMVEQKP